MNTIVKVFIPPFLFVVVYSIVFFYFFFTNSRASGRWVKVFGIRFFFHSCRIRWPTNIDSSALCCAWSSNSHLFKVYYSFLYSVPIFLCSLYLALSDFQDALSKQDIAFESFQQQKTLLEDALSEAQHQHLQIEAFGFLFYLSVSMHSISVFYKN